MSVLSPFSLTLPVPSFLPLLLLYVTACSMFTSLPCLYFMYPAWMPLKGQCAKPYNHLKIPQEALITKKQNKTDRTLKRKKREHPGRRDEREPKQNSGLMMLPVDFADGHWMESEREEGRGWGRRRLHCCSYHCRVFHALIHNLAQEVSRDSHKHSHAHVLPWDMQACNPHLVIRTFLHGQLNILLHAYMQTHGIGPLSLVIAREGETVRMEKTAGNIKGRK